MLVGCVVYAQPTGSTAWRVTNDIKHNQVIELIRLFTADRHPHTGKNLESCAIGKSILWLNENKPEVKVILSYADPAVGHEGTIYLASGFSIQDVKQNFYKETSNQWVFSTDDGYTWSYPRWSRQKYGTTLESFKKTVKKRPFLAKKINTKIRYIKIITPDKEEAKRIRFCLLHPIIHKDDLPEFKVEAPVLVK